MRIVLIGSVQFSLSAFRQLCQMNANIVGVCTKKSSIFNTDHADLSVFSAEQGIPFLYVQDINAPEVITWIEALNADIIFCFGWSQILKNQLLDIAPLGVIGFHPSELPKNRGRHPLIWSLVLGLESTGSTFFFMDSGTDSGDIISQRKIIIDRDDVAESLYRKVTITALDQIKEFVPQIESGLIKREKQDPTFANIWRKRDARDGLIDWRMTAESIHNLVRGLSGPYIGAHFIHGGKEIKVWKTMILYDFPTNIEPGKVLLCSEMGPVVKCGEGAIALLSTSPEFKTIEGAYL